MNDLLTNPYSFDAYKVETDSQGRAIIPAKIMKVGRLKYDDGNGGTYYGDITLPELKKAVKSASLKPVTIKHPPRMLKPSDVTKYQEGISADGYEIKEIDGEQWLTGPVVLQSQKAIKTAENGKLGVSAGYFRKAVATDVKGVFNFEDIDINHIAIGCDNPRAEGAGLSLDEAEDDSARIYSFAKQQEPKKKQEVEKMKQKLNAVKVGDFSLDEAPIEYDENDSSRAIDVLTGREEQMVNALECLQESLDSAKDDHVKEKGDLSGANKILEDKVKELETKMEGMVSLDDIDARVQEMAEVHEVAKRHGIDAKFKTPSEGMRAVVEKVSPDRSFDDAEISGAFKMIEGNEADTSERIKSKEALDKFKNSSMDSGRVPISKIDPSELRKKSKK